MSFNPKNPIYSPEVSSDPSSPPTGTRGLYPKSDGWYDINGDGFTEKIVGKSYVDAALEEEASQRKSADDSKVDKVKGFGVGHVQRLIGHGKEWSQVVFSSGSPNDSVKIPAYTSDLENDSGFADKTSVDVALEQKEDSENKGQPNGYAPLDANGKLPDEYLNESFVKNARPYIENTIPTTETLSPNTIYDIGVQNDLTLILPTAEVGNFIQVDFLSGATATTLTVSAASSALLSDYDFTPEPNMIYSLFFDYGALGYDETAHSNIYGWRFNYAEYTYTPDGSEG